MIDLVALGRWSALPLRLAVGVVFLVHGAQKLFVFGPAGTAAFFEKIHVPAAGFTALVVIAVELLGGLALLLGAFTRVAALLLAVDMLGAILLVHLAAGFFLPNGYEFTLTLLAASLSLVFMGAGPASIDAALGLDGITRARR